MEPHAPPSAPGKGDDPLRLVAERRARRRRANLCFFAAGIGFGTALYLLRTRFHTLAPPEKGLAFLTLVAIMVGLFWLGARAESDVTRIEARLRELAEARATRRGPADSME